MTRRIDHLPEELRTDIATASAETPMSQVRLGYLPTRLPERLPDQSITIVIRYRAERWARACVTDDGPVVIDQRPADGPAVGYVPPGLVSQP